MLSPAVQQLADQFVAELQDMVINAISVQSLIRDAGPQPPEHFNCRSVLADGLTGTLKIRRRAPVQLCPAPRCANRAAPIFGMLCASHKDAPKKTVAKWRAARRARKSS